MSKGVFGGDTRFAYFRVAIPVRVPSDERRIAQRTLHEKYGREKYFQYRHDDERGKERARKACEKLCAKMIEETGFDLYVAECVFL